jgi:hypothetical protein
VENGAWEEAALADTITMLDAATMEETQRRRAEALSERRRAEWERLRMEWELHHRERREALEHQRQEQHLREVAAATEAAWASEADALATTATSRMEEEEDDDDID